MEYVLFTTNLYSNVRILLKLPVQNKNVSQFLHEWAKL